MIGSPEKIAADRSQLIEDANRGIESIASSGSSADSTLQANALLTKGDLNWTLANLPSITGAATQPALQLPSSTEQYLKQAEDAYQQVIKSFPDQKNAALKAQFALAAIAENRHDWDGAIKIYEQIKQAGDVDQMYKDLADARIKLIPEIKQPVLIGALTEKPADLAPLVMAPSSQPATKPATQPSAAPATQPAAK
jgi:tetratricopeptide (TPR) repeat protein